MNHARPRANFISALLLVPIAAMQFGSLPRLEAMLAGALRARGFAVLPKPQLGTKALAQLQQFTSERLDAELARVCVADAGPPEQGGAFGAFTFGEVVEDQQLMRWDLRMPEGDEAWSSACTAIIEAAMPVLETLHPPEEAGSVRPLSSGVLISRPGAGTESWHSDAEEDPAHFERAATSPHCRIYNVYMPFEPLERNTDGLEFWAGTHDKQTSGISCRPVGTQPPKPVGVVDAPGCAAGGLLLADSRVKYRGRANTGEERQIAYVVLGVNANRDGQSEGAAKCSGGWVRLSPPE
jgi:hypothetical protein